MNISFSEFINQYELSKTLRFELKPIGKTDQMLKDNNIFAIDKIRKEKYEKIKPYFDRLHRKFIDKALSSVKLENLVGYNELYKKYKKDKQNKDIQKAFDEKNKIFRTKIVSYFKKQNEQWKEEYIHLKLPNKDILFSKEVFSLLEELYGDEQDTIIEDDSIFNGFKGFTGYFTKFHETRKNFYSEKAQGTALANRIIHENLPKFCDNIDDFIKAKKTGIDFSEVETNFEKDLDNVFTLDFYTQCLLQDDIDVYNKILGGYVKENGEKLRGVNELINEFRQNNKDKKTSFLKMLDKQIASEKESFIHVIEDKEELLQILKKFYKEAEGKINILSSLFTKFTSTTFDSELSQIYISKECFNTLCHRWTSETEAFEKSLSEILKQSGEKLPKPKNGEYKFPDFISLQSLKETLENIEEEKQKVFWKERYQNEIIISETIWNQFLGIFKFEFHSLLEKTIHTDNRNKSIGYNIYKKSFKEILKVEVFTLTNKDKMIIKDFSDSVLSIYQMAKYFSLEKKRQWNPENLEISDFYHHNEYGYSMFYNDAYESIIQPYNLIRNFITKKPSDTAEKWKLNFENGSDFLGGWDQNQEMKKYGIILRKDNKYFLAIFKKEFRNKIFRKEEVNSWSSKIEKAYNIKKNEPCYEKLEYKAIADPSKDISLLLARASKENLALFKPSNEILKIKEEGTFKKGSKFNIQNLHKIINYYKKSIPQYKNWEIYNFTFSDTSKYKTIADFTDEMGKYAYKIWFEDISEQYIQEKNENGELYLFQIKNKDWNEGATGAKNLQTLYFEQLFSEENIANNFIAKLNGKAELFFRPKSEEIKKEKRNFKREIIKNKRYTEDKIFFHIPITLNREKGEAKQFNQKINNYLKGNTKINIIGIDRGEKHLAYYTVIDQQGNILKDIEGNPVSDTLNVINGVDYHEKLTKRAEDRIDGRKNWEQIQQIKDLKKGYISQVVRKLADLIIKYNAIIVFEDLNMRFKQIRGGIEKSVYQQLEKALIDKLGFLVNKGEKNPQEAGHILKAYQLSAPFESFQKMGKQTGIIFYTQAAYTSKIDPLTGWRPNLYLKTGNAKINKNNILKFSQIIFNKNKDRFEISYDIKNFIISDKAKYPSKTQWTVCSNIERFRWNRSLNNNKGGYDTYSTSGKESITEKLKELFKNYNIDFEQENILDQIKKIEPQGNEKIFSNFLLLFKLICQIRNTDEKLYNKIEQYRRDDKYKQITKQDIFDADFILSPVEPFFDSRKALDFREGLPQNGDENGSYNIARKGIIILNKISEYYENNNNNNGDKLSWNDLYVSSTDWDNFIQK
jgi:hypothetical protein